MKDIQASTYMSGELQELQIGEEESLAMPGQETCLFNRHKAFQPIWQAERQPFGTDVQNASPYLGADGQVFELQQLHKFWEAASGCLPCEGKQVVVLLLYTCHSKSTLTHAFSISSLLRHIVVISVVAWTCPKMRSCKAPACDPLTKEANWLKLHLVKMQQREGQEIE